MLSPRRLRRRRRPGRFKIRGSNNNNNRDENSSSSPTLLSLLLKRRHPRNPSVTSEQAIAAIVADVQNDNEEGDIEDTETENTGAAATSTTNNTTTPSNSTSSPDPTNITSTMVINTTTSSIINDTITSNTTMTTTNSTFDGNTTDSALAPLTGNMTTMNTTDTTLNITDTNATDMNSTNINITDVSVSDTNITDINITDTNTTDTDTNNNNITTTNSTSTTSNVTNVPAIVNSSSFLMQENTLVFINGSLYYASNSSLSFILETAAQNSSSESFSSSSSSSSSFFTNSSSGLFAFGNTSSLSSPSPLMFSNNNSNTSVLFLLAGGNVSFASASAFASSLDGNVSVVDASSFVSFMGGGDFSFIKNSVFSNASLADASFSSSTNKTVTTTKRKVGERISKARKRKSSIFRIVGGTSTQNGQFPWMVALYNQDDPTGFLPFCGGSLITPSVVLTAAQCIVDVRSVVIGRNQHEGAAAEEEQIQVFSNLQRRIHPDFRSDAFDFDYGVILLSEPVVDPVFVNLRRNTEIPDDLEIMGWGLLRDGGDQATDLQAANVRRVSFDDCTENYLPEEITVNMFCANEDGVDSCEGDTGGAIVARGTNIQVGISSWGNGCADARFPGVYARISSAIEWLDRIVCEDLAPDECQDGRIPASDDSGSPILRSASSCEDFARNFRGLGKKLRLRSCAWVGRRTELRCRWYGREFCPQTCQVEGCV